MLLAKIFLTGYAAIAKYLMNFRSVQLIDLIFYRAVATLVFPLLIALVTDTSFKIPPGYRVLVAVRGLIGALTFMFFFVALQYIPLFLFNVFDGMTPFWGILFGWIMLGLKLSLLEWVTLVVSFSAISLIYFSAKE